MRTKSKRWALYLKNWASYANFHVATKEKNLVISKFSNLSIPFNFWDFGLYFGMWSLYVPGNKCSIAILSPKWVLTWYQIAATESDMPEEVGLSEPIRCILFTNTIPVRCILFTGTVPVGCALFTGTVPVRYTLFTGTVPVNNLFLLGMLFLWQRGNKVNFKT